METIETRKPWKLQNIGKHRNHEHFGNNRKKWKPWKQWMPFKPLNKQKSSGYTARSELQNNQPPGARGEKQSSKCVVSKVEVANKKLHTCPGWQENLNERRPCGDLCKGKSASRRTKQETSAAKSLIASVACPQAHPVTCVLHAQAASVWHWKQFRSCVCWT